MSAVLVASIYIIWVLLLILAVAVFALYRYFGQMYVNSAEGREKQGPEVGSSLLSIAREDVHDKPLTLPVARPTLIMFADTTCDICSYLRDHLSALDEYANRIEIVVFCSGQHHDVEAWASRVPAHVRVIADVRAKAAHHYEVNGTPFMISVGMAGIVQAKGIVNTEEGLVWAAEEALSSQPDTVGVQKAGVQKAEATHT
ncbi:MAG: hypothetical protein ACM3ML_05780 [Micromonosporaceae bacterium]